MKNLKPGVYKTAELEKILGNRMAVTRACEQRLLERVSQGLYATNDIVDPRTISNMIIAKYYPEAVVSKGSALDYHGLSDDPCPEFHVDTKNDNSYIAAKNILQFHRSKYIRGVTTGNFNGNKLNVYLPERAVFEVLYLDTGIGVKATEVVTKYLENFYTDGSAVSKLGQYSVDFGVRGEALMSLARSIRQSKEIY